MTTNSTRTNCDGRPEPYIYLFAMPATRLRQLSAVYRRERSVVAAEGIQRARADKRTARIKRYIEAGYPFGDLRPRVQEKNLHLRKPGWLPTAIVVNILRQGDQRRGKTIAEKHVARLAERDGQHYLRLPKQNDFARRDVRPFEVIDGQHRLWAFDEDNELSEFELPVVAFSGLDIAWQAYLFWSINISPERINPSHAFDLYPLLRTQDWLEGTGEITVYRTARAQGDHRMALPAPDQPLARPNQHASAKRRTKGQPSCMGTLAPQLLLRHRTRGGGGTVCSNRNTTMKERPSTGSESSKSPSLSRSGRG